MNGPRPRMRWLLPAASLGLALQAPALRVRLTAADGPLVRVALHPEDTVVLELPVSTAAGYSWRLRKGDGGGPLALLGSVVRPNGIAGVDRIAWRAQSDGTQTVELEYTRDRYGRTAPEKRFLIEALVTGKALAPGEPPLEEEPTEGELAVYAGRLPCTNCAGGDALLTLMGESRGASGTFLLRQERNVTPEEGRLTLETGAWERRTGTPGDAAAVVYVLELASGAEAFLAEGERLLPLDAQGVPHPEGGVLTRRELSLRHRS